MKKVNIERRWRCFIFVWCVVFAAVGPVESMAADAPGKPLMRDFMGLCVHTVQFKPQLYQPVCRLLRDYHGLNWDVGDSTANATIFPFAHNRVDWGRMYGEWVTAGYEIDASIMLGAIAYEQWKDPAADAFRYGEAFARFFGPGSHSLVTSAEIGNEPGEYSDEQYRLVFENMARGFRKGDPALKVVTCAAVAGKSHKYAKSLDCVKGLESLYDVINVHSYAQVTGWPTWRRSFPEDPTLAYLKDIQDAIDWRNTNAVGKQVWLTEFGWDSTTKPNHTEGTFKDWIGNTDAQQAAYLVRSWLVFSAMDLDRAYMYYFNDNDQPSVHAASGLTRDYQPKPSFWAVAHLYAALGDFRFQRKIIEQSGKLYAYEYTHSSDPSRKIITVWQPLEASGAGTADIPLSKGTLTKIERMPLDQHPAPILEYRCQDGIVTLPCSGYPVYLFVTE